MKKERTLRWHDFCHAMYALGMMRDFSKGECYRARRILLASGRVKQVGRGLYALR
jgi:hypothetical protein